MSLQHTEIEIEDAPLAAPPPPVHNGPYAWRAIVPCTIAVSFSVMGTQYCAGVLTHYIYQKFLTEELDGTYSEWSQFTGNGVGSIAIGVLMLSMAPAGKLQAKMGQQKVVAMGACLIILGLLGTAIATELWHVYLGYSVVCSFGMGFCYLGAATSCALWFTPDKRAFAVAIATGGSGIGTVTLGHLTLAVFDEKNGIPLSKESVDEKWQTIFLLLAAICGVGTLVPAYFFVPPTVQNAQPITLSTRVVLATPDYPYFLLVLAVFGLGAWNVICLWPALINVHAKEQVAVFAGAVEIGFGIGALFGRPIAAEILTRTGRRQGFPGILLMMAVAAFLAPSCSSSYAGVLINNLFYGWGFGAFIATMPPITAEIVGPEKMAVALGLTYAAPGISFAIGGPLCALFEIDMAFYFSGACMVLSAMMMAKLSISARAASR